MSSSDTLSMIGHQAKDGLAHIAYYNQEYDLSFVWNGTYGINVDICKGGYGERVIARMFLSFDPNKTPLAQALAAFAKDCENFILAIAK